MTESLRLLGQVVPSAVTLTPLYTVPAATTTAISSLIVCNQSSSVGVLFRISIAINGAADTPAQYIYYDLPLDTNDTFIVTVGLSLASGDVVRVQSSNANTSFNLCGCEVT